jgi:hypothetical protein
MLGPGQGTGRRMAASSTRSEHLGSRAGFILAAAAAVLVGLNFDSTYESITKDWYFDPAITRAIHVDARYMLWVMSELDGADNLLREMRIVYPAGKR